MKKKYTIVTSMLLLCGIVFAQEENQFNSHFDPVRLELENWDPIRGPWLSSSLEAMSKDEPIPDRTFPEDVTPAQMVRLLPEKTRSSVERTMISYTPTNESELNQWNEIRQVVVRPNAGCDRVIGRTYGDPHLVTFDGARYSFQTVGEFVLARSTSGFQVQARQQPQGDDFSLNTAVAMNVGGDRVGIYARSTPDARRDTPVRVHGLPVNIDNNQTYFLRNGGTILRQNSNYTVSWPSGEVVKAQIRGAGRGATMNITVVVSECNEGIFEGLLGNMNGDERDDIRGLNSTAGLGFPRGNDPFFGSSRELEQRRLAFIANSFGDQYRVTQLTSLFDYGFGESTLSYTDRSFPRVHRTINELSDRQRRDARNRCEQMGVNPRDLNGCVFDNAHLGMEPTPRPEIKDPSEGIQLKPIEREIPNVNPVRTETVAPKDTEVKQPKLTPLPIAEPEKECPVKEVRSSSSSPREVETRSTPRPVRTEPRSTSRNTSVFGGSSSTRSTPSTRTTTTTRPRSTSTPKPRPTPPPRPTPKPKPKPPVSKPKPTGRGGR